MLSVVPMFKLLLFNLSDAATTGLGHSPSDVGAHTCTLGLTLWLHVWLLVVSVAIQVKYHISQNLNVGRHEHD